MSRSLWKPTLQLHNNNLKTKNSKNFLNLVLNRKQTITKDFLNNTVKIYNGIKFFEIVVTEKMFGYKFGEFAPTRKIPLHKKKKTVLKKKK